LAGFAVLFPGQGTQKTGMGASLYEHSSAARQVFDGAEAVFPGIRALCFTGEQERLNETLHAQSAVVTVELAAFAALREKGLVPSAGAGFSLGEYAALCANGRLTLTDCLQLVKRRSHWMQEQCVKHPGGMAAVLGKSQEELSAVLEEIDTKGGLLQPVNFNCPGQIVVAGDSVSLQKLLDYCKQHKIRCVKLAVSGAFHSSYMRPAADKIAAYISELILYPFQFPLYANVSAGIYTQENFMDWLPRQTYSPVLFDKTIRNMIKDGYTTFVEVGPGTTLGALVRRIDKNAVVYSVSDAQSLEQCVDDLNRDTLSDGGKGDK
jgi:[acyl-carrier-protein] S-malonyltransferase